MQYNCCTFTAMGSPCQFQLYAPTQSKVEITINRLLQEVDILEARYSRYKPDSLVSKINRVAETGGSIVVDEEISQLLNYANVCFEQSEGLFDITTGVLRKAWDFKSGKLPSQDLIAELIKHIGWEKVRWTPPELSFSMKGMELDFGGIVKEYATDRCAVICKDHGIEHGLIDLGGDIRVIGPHPDGDPWKIGIQDPFNPELNMLEIKMDCGGLASSGDYARCITIHGRLYSHILSPRTGWPTEGLRAVSVISEQCLTSGSLSTIAMLKGKSGQQWLEEQNIDYVCMDTDGLMSGSLWAGN